MFLQSWTVLMIVGMKHRSILQTVYCLGFLCLINQVFPTNGFSSGPSPDYTQDVQVLSSSSLAGKPMTSNAQAEVFYIVKLKNAPTAAVMNSKGEVVSRLPADSLVSMATKKEKRLSKVSKASSSESISAYSASIGKTRGLSTSKLAAGADSLSATQTSIDSGVASAAKAKADSYHADRLTADMKAQANAASSNGRGMPTLFGAVERLASSQLIQMSKGNPTSEAVIINADLPPLKGSKAPKKAPVGNSGAVSGIKQITKASEATHSTAKSQNLMASQNSHGMKTESNVYAGQAERQQINPYTMDVFPAGIAGASNGILSSEAVSWTGSAGEAIKPPNYVDKARASEAAKMAVSASGNTRSLTDSRKMMSASNMNAAAYNGGLSAMNPYRSISVQDNQHGMIRNLVYGGDTAAPLHSQFATDLFGAEVRGWNGGPSSASAAASGIEGGAASTVERGLYQSDGPSSGTGAVSNPNGYASGGREMSTAHISSNQMYAQDTAKSMTGSRGAASRSGSMALADRQKMQEGMAYSNARSMNGAAYKPSRAIGAKESLVSSMAHDQALSQSNKMGMTGSSLHASVADQLYNQFVRDFLGADGALLQTQMAHGIRGIQTGAISSGQTAAEPNAQALHEQTGVNKASLSSQSKGNSYKSSSTAIFGSASSATKQMVDSGSVGGSAAAKKLAAGGSKQVASGINAVASYQKSAGGNGKSTMICILADGPQAAEAIMKVASSVNTGNIAVSKATGAAASAASESVGTVLEGNAASSTSKAAGSGAGIRDTTSMSEAAMTAAEVAAAEAAENLAEGGGAQASAANNPSTTNSNAATGTGSATAGEPAEPVEAPEPGEAPVNAAPPP